MKKPLKLEAFVVYTILSNFVGDNINKGERNLKAITTNFTNYTNFTIMLPKANGLTLKVEK